MHGISLRRIEDQLELLADWVHPIADDLSAGPVHHRAAGGGGRDGGYGEIEADVLYSFIVSNKPGRIVQVGCGVSTVVALMAAERADYHPDLICIDPFPSAFLREAHDRGQIRLIAEPAQAVAYEMLSDLGTRDLLFVDSTHAVKTGSEVNYLVHEVLPRLSEGVWVHFHDIYFPYDYPRDATRGDLFFPQETALLYSFLLGNHRYRVEVSLSMLHYAAPAELRRLFPRYDPNDQADGLAGHRGSHFPSATWLRVTGGVMPQPRLRRQ